MRYPCSAKKRVMVKDNKGNEKYNYEQSRSPFNLGLDEIFLNNWNLNQTFVLKGSSTERQFMDFLEVVQKRSIGATIIRRPIEEMNLSKVICLQNLKELKTRSRDFLIELNKLRIQLRYSLLALLSENKVSIFNETLITLMKNLHEKNWSQTEDTADYGSFLLDKMHIYLEPKKMPYIDLNEFFIESKEKNKKELEDEFMATRNNLNFMIQHRVIVTPTLIKFTVGEEEETNRVVRNFKEQLPNFVRLCFLTDTNEKGYYCGGFVDSLLGYIHSIISHGFTVG